MNHTPLLLVLAALSAPALSQTPALPAPNAESQRLNAIFDAQWEATARRHPEVATFRGDHRFGDRWTDNRPAAREQRDREDRETLQQLKAIDRTRLDATDQVSLDMAVRRLGAAQAGAAARALGAGRAAGRARGQRHLRPLQDAGLGDRAR